MYQMSQSCCGRYSCSYQSNRNSLEYITQNAVGYENNHSISSYENYPPINGSKYRFSAQDNIAVPYRQESSASAYQQCDIAYDLVQIHCEYHFLPDDFLLPGKKGSFVGKAEKVRSFVEETFEKMFRQSFPSDIKISVLDKNRFKKLASSPGTIGLSINRRKQGLLSEIFVLNDYLARVMLTIGHELGHVLTARLENAHDEEAKAYAFSLVWMEVIKKNNIANLGDAFITENPAQNGLHDVAFDFVQRLVQQGKNVVEVYHELSSGKVMIQTML